MHDLSRENGMPDIFIYFSDSIISRVILFTVVLKFSMLNYIFAMYVMCIVDPSPSVTDVGGSFQIGLIVNFFNSGLLV